MFAGIRGKFQAAAVSGAVLLATGTGAYFTSEKGKIPAECPGATTARDEQFCRQADAFLAFSGGVLLGAAGAGLLAWGVAGRKEEPAAASAQKSLRKNRKI